MKYRYPIGLLVISFIIGFIINAITGDEGIPNTIITTTFVISLWWSIYITIRKGLTEFKKFLFELIDKIKE